MGLIPISMIARWYFLLDIVF